MAEIMPYSFFSRIFEFRVLALIVVLSCMPLRAAVVVLVNRSDNPVKFQIVRADGSQSAATLVSGDQKVVPSEEQIGIVFTAGQSVRHYRLSANTIYFFAPKDGVVDLHPLELPVSPGEVESPPKPRIIARTTIKIPVKLVADQAQPAVQKIWEKEFRERVAKASKIFEEHCGVVFEVAAVEMWQSDNSITDFGQSLREFETKVQPTPAKLAIGFTSQYQQPDGQTHLGGTRGPLYPYVLVREWSQHVSKNERLEILAHELGHFLGAVHSGAGDSLMRPQLGDRLSNAAAFRVGFDPLNTLAMNIFADELRSAPYRGMHRLPLDARRQLLRIYARWPRSCPRIPPRRNTLPCSTCPRGSRSRRSLKISLDDATKTVVKAIVDAAQVNNMGIRVYEGDDLTEFYVHRAAAAAANLPPDVAADAFLLGLGIGLNDAVSGPQRTFVWRVLPADRIERRIFGSHQTARTAHAWQATRFGTAFHDLRGAYGPPRPRRRRKGRAAQGTD